MRVTLIILLLFINSNSFSQGYNHNWLLGYTTNPALFKAKAIIDSNSFTISPELRKIPFWETQGNISDSNGNLLLSSNGIYIADAFGDTVLNGSDINPGQFRDNFKDFGLPMPYANLILPIPEDSNKYVLFHQVANYSATVGLCATEIFYSVIDMSLNGGLGEVISKNNVLISGSFGWGLSACKHGNGRDWWVIALSDSARISFDFILKPDTIIFSGSQQLQVPGFPQGFAGQPTFSPDGSKFAFASSTINSTFYNSQVQLFDFDRCTGVFNLDTLIDYSDGYVSFGTSFSSNSKHLYFSTAQKIFQIDTDTSDIGATYQLIATNDTFLSATPNFYTNFHLLYLAANGKIYISSTSSVKHLHEINYPDSAGLACNVQLHNIYTDCFYIGVPNHPNYYLGRKIGSPCDSLTSINDITQHDFRFSISPNPTNGNFKIIYLLPQNKNGTLQILDITGKEIYKQNLPQWSTLQNISLPNLASGVYAVKINSDNFSVTKKLLVQQE